ncbi:MAG: acetyl-CoA carboxylase biotin carboxyl carrier protein subunit [Vulcanimicrobiota bacterium]
MKTIKSSETGEINFELDSQVGVLKVAEQSYRCGSDYVVLDGRRVPFWVYREGQNVSVWLDGEVYRFELGAPRRRVSNGASEAAAGGTVKARMPGKVLRVEVKVGDAVQAGDDLLLMESMKMELALTAPVRGTVRKVEVKPEQMVSQGALLVEIEEE